MVATPAFALLENLARGFAVVIDGSGAAALTGQHKRPSGMPRFGLILRGFRSGHPKSISLLVHRFHGIDVLEIRGANSDLGKAKKTGW